MSQSAAAPSAGMAMPTSSRAPMPGGSKGAFPSQFRNADNVYDQSAAGLGGAMMGAGNAMGYQPLMVNGGGYNAAQVDPGSFNFQAPSNIGYNAATVNAPNRSMYEYNPMMVNAGSYDAGQLANTSLDPYMNPYTNTVIDNSLNDIERARAMSENMSDAQATAAGAFGGSRQALMRTENNRNFLDQSARTSGQLRQAGYQNAQQAALRDIAGRDSANQFNLGLDMQGQLANQAATGRANEFAGGIAAQQAMQAGLANQAAQNAASRFGSEANYQGQLEAQRANLQAQMQAALSNQSSMNRASEFGLNTANSAYSEPISSAA